MYTIVGLERKVGSYEGREYDNTYLHCTFDRDKCDGLAVATLKVKTAVFEAKRGECYLGAVITPFFDRYGNVIELRAE